MSGYLDLSVITKNLPFLLDGLLLTFKLTVLAVTGGLTLGIALALIRLSGIRPLAWAIEAYVNLLRSMPLILVIFWFYMLVPKLIGGSISSFYSVLIAFVLFEAAYYSEIIRAGISSIKRGQISAGLAIGFTKMQTMRYIIMPQALRNMMPVIVSQSIVMFQDTSLVYVVGLRDFLSTAEIIVGRDSRPVEIYLFVALVFLAICLAASKVANRLRRSYSL